MTLSSTFYTSDFNIPQFSRVRIVGGKLVLAGASDVADGTAINNICAGTGDITQIILPSTTETIPANLAGTCEIGATLYAAANGRVASSGTVAIGTAAYASSGDRVHVVGLQKDQEEDAEFIQKIGLTPTSLTSDEVAAAVADVADHEDRIHALENANIAYLPTQGTIAGTVIDLTSGDFFKITNSGNSTYSLTNVAGMNEGEVRNIYINNGNYTWALSGATWDGTAPTIPVNKLTWVQIQKLFGVACARMMSATGYALDVAAPTSLGFTIDLTGTFGTWAFSEPVKFADASPDTTGLVLSYSGVTWSYQSGAGTAALTYVPSRTILAADGAATFAYTRPTGGIMYMSGNVLANITGGTVTNNSTATSWLLSENWGSQNGWSNSTTATYNNAAIDSGTASMILPGSSGNSTYKDFTGTSTTGVFMALKMPSSWPTNSADSLCYITGPNIDIRLSTSGQLVFKNGTLAAYTSAAQTLGAVVFVWLDITVGTGSNGVLDVYISSSVSSKGSALVHHTTGTGTANPSRINFSANYSANTQVGRVRISNATIGANPG